jgi:hypothetical protein
MNLRWKENECARVPLVMGFRMIGLDDNFRLGQELQGRSISWIDTTTNNMLYGFQIGTEPILWCYDGFQLEGLLKTGIFSNQAHQRSRFPILQSELENWNGASSFVAETGLIGSYHWNNCWAIRGGYEVMWITNVALAPDQSTTVFYGTTPTGRIYDRATAFYHGATVSIERRF